MAPGQTEAWLILKVIALHPSPARAGGSYLPALPKLITDLPQVMDENLWLDRLMQHHGLNLVDLEGKSIARDA